MSSPRRGGRQREPAAARATEEVFRGFRGAPIGSRLGPVHPLRRLAWLVCLLALGCKPKVTGPSPEFERARVALEAALSETLDPSYGDPAFDEVEALLRAVPPDAPDRLQAELIAAEIERGRAQQRKLMGTLADPGLARAAVQPAEDPWKDLAPAEAEEPEAMAAEARVIAEQTEARVALVAERAPVVRPRSKPARPIVMYTTAWCGVCKRARSWLEEQDVDFVEQDIEQDPSAREELAAKARSAGVALRGVPVIDVGGTLLQGFSAQGMARVLASKGYR